MGSRWGLVPIITFHTEDMTSETNNRNQLQENFIQVSFLQPIHINQRQYPIWTPIRGCKILLTLDNIYVFLNLERPKKGSKF